MANFEILDLDSKNKWIEYLHSLPLEQQDVYYTPEYYSLYENYGDGKALCFFFEKDGDIALYPFLLNSVNELGYELDNDYFDIQGAYGYNGVVSSSYDEAFITEFYESFTHYCKDKNVIAEFTRFHPLIKNQIFSEGKMAVVYNRKTVYVDLSLTIDEIISNYKRTTRQELQKAYKKYNMDVRIFENGTELLDVFVNMYYDNMRRLSAIPQLYFNPQYFNDLMKMKNSFMVVVYYNDKPIAAAINIIYNHYVQGHLACALNEYRSMTPSNVLYTEAIKYGKKMGCKYFHVGGGNTENENDNLLKYKKNFSKSTSTFYIGIKIHNKYIYNEVVKQWSDAYSEKVDKYKNILLKYRY